MRDRISFEKRKNELESASKELIDWLSKYGCPYTKIIVSQDKITVTEDEIGIPVKQ